VAETSDVAETSNVALPSGFGDALPGRQTFPISGPGPAHAEVDVAADARVDAADRGALIVTDRVVERIAEFAAGRVQGVVAGGSRWDRTVGRHLPRAHARTAGRRARLVVEIAVAWPVVLATVAAEVRAVVTDRLRDLASIDADGVDVLVVKVVVPPTPGRVS
jgi:uncharacterized alkaline shock family protein YloU